MDRLRSVAAALLLVSCGRAPPPRNAGDLLKSGEAHFAGARYEQAQQAFEGALRLEPRLLPAIRGRVEAARKRGAMPALIAELSVRAGAAPRDALAWYALGLARFAQGEEKAAVAALSQAAELSPDEADFHFRLGIALFDSERFGEARAPLEKAMKLAPRAARYRAPLAACLARLGDRKAAIAVLRDVPSLEPTADEAALAVKTARAITDPFRGVPQPARPELEAGLAHLLRDAPGLAIPVLEGLVKRFPDLAPAWSLLGLAAQRVDEAGRAVTALQRAAELAPEMPQPHVYLAELYAARERLDLAEGEYAAALERDPLDVATLRKLGQLRLNRSRPRALEPLRRAAALAPADDALQLLVARAEAAGGEAATAGARLEKLAQKRPEDPEVLLRLALLLFEERGKAAEPARAELTQRLEKLLEKVLSLQPQNAAATRMLTAIRAG